MSENRIKLLLIWVLRIWGNSRSLFDDTSVCVWGGVYFSFQYGMLCVANIRKHEHCSSVSPNFLESFVKVLVWEGHHLLSKSHPSTLSVSHLPPPFLPTFADSKENQVHKESKLCCMTAFVSAVLHAKLGGGREGEGGGEGRKGKRERGRTANWGMSVSCKFYGQHIAPVIFNSRT